MSNLVNNSNPINNNYNLVPVSNTDSKNGIDPAISKVIEELQKIKDEIKALTEKGLPTSELMKRLDQLFGELSVLAKDLEGITDICDKAGITKQLEEVRALIINTVESYRSQIGTILANAIEKGVNELINYTEDNTQGLSPEQQKLMNGILEDLNKVFVNIQDIFKTLASYYGKDNHSWFDKLRLGCEIAISAIKILPEIGDIVWQATQKPA